MYILGFTEMVKRSSEPLRGCGEALVIRERERG